jgi:hypothetical protein
MSIPEILAWGLLLLLGVVAGTVGGVVGFGSSIVLMPALVVMFGAKEAVPLIALSGLLANLSRSAVWWRDIDWRVTVVYLLPAVPAAILGARTMLSLDARMVEAGLGAFLLFAVPARRWLIAQGLTVPLWGMSIVGGGIGFLAGLVATTGPINTPFYLAYGLTKGAFLATEAIASAAISLTKIATFRTLGALSTETIVRGLTIGVSLMVGSWLAKPIVARFDGRQYQRLLEALMIGAGAWLLGTAVIG